MTYPTSFPLDSWKAKYYRLLHPGWGTCLRCGMPWVKVESHRTQYNETSGCFPLCQECWDQLTPSERLPFYQQLIAVWEEGGHPPDPGVKEQIQRAVMRGL